MRSKAVSKLVLITLLSLTDYVRAGNLDPVKGCVDPETRDELQGTIDATEAAVPADVTRVLELCKGTKVQFKVGDDRIYINIDGPSFILKCETLEDCTIDGGNTGRHVKGSREFDGEGGFMNGLAFSKVGSAFSVEGIMFQNFGVTYNGGVFSFVNTASLNLRFYKCKFKENYAKFDGGAIYFHKLDDVQIQVYFKSCYFSKNTADLYGGAIAFRIIDWGVEIEMRDTNFEHNMAKESGGAVVVSGPYFENHVKILIKDCHFKHNKAYKWAGGIYIHDVDVLRFKNTEFDKNVADSYEAYVLVNINAKKADQLDLNKDTWKELCGSSSRKQRSGGGYVVN